MNFDFLNKYKVKNASRAAKR